MAAEEGPVIRGDVAPLPPPGAQPRLTRLDDDDPDVGGLGTPERGSHRRRRVPDVTDDVALRARRWPPGEDHVDLRRLVVTAGLAHVAAGRQSNDPPRPAECRKLVETHDEVAVQREGGALGAQVK